MAGNDELIYTIKFDLDSQTYSESLSKIKELEKAKAGGGEGSDKATERTIEFREETERLTEENVELIDKLIQLQEQMDIYRATLKEVRDAKREGVDLSSQEREAEAQTQAALKSTSQEYRDNQKSLIANNNATDMAKGSYNQLRAETKLLEQQLRAMPIDDQSEEFKSLQAQIAKNKKDMKEFNADIGDHSMNVGNYAESLSTVASGLAIIQGPLGPLAGRLNSLNTTLQASIPIIHAKAKAWGVLKLAIASTGIGAIIVAIGTLGTALATMQPVMDAISKRWAQLGAIWGKARDTIGSWFGMNEKSNLSMRESIRIAGELVEAEQELRDARIEDITVMAELETQVAQLRQQAEDENISAEKRIKLMDEAREKNRELMQMKIKRAEEEARIAIERGKMARNESADNKEIAEAIAQVTKLKGQMATQDRQLTRRRQSIINQLEVETERRRKNIEAIEEEAKARYEAHQDLMTSATGDPLLTLEEQRQQRLVELLGKFGHKKKAVEFEMQHEIQALYRETNDEIASLQEEREERVLALKKKYETEGMTSDEAEAEARAEIKRRMSAEITAIEEGMAIKEKTIRENANNEIEDIEYESLQKQKGIREQVGQMRAQQIMSQAALEKALMRGMHRELAEIEAEEAVRRNELLIENMKSGMEQEEALRLARQQAQMEFAEEKAQTMIAIDEQEMQDRLAMMQAYTDLAFGVMNAAFGDTKAVRVAQAIIDTYAGANSALADPGGKLGIVQAAATIAMGLANVRKILSTDVGDSPSGGGGGTASGGLSSQMGYEVVDSSVEGGVARQVAEQAESQQVEASTNIYLQGDLNKEMMAIKAREGNRTINTKTLTTKSRQ